MSDHRLPTRPLTAPSWRSRRASGGRSRPSRVAPGSRPGASRPCAPAAGALLREAERGQRAGRLADVPLDRVQPVAAVGDVRDAEVLARRQQVLDAPRDQGAERDLERQRADVDVVVAAAAGVQVDAVAADADRVGERLRGELAALLPSAFARASVPTCCSSTVNSARMRRDSRMYGRLGQAVGGADDVGPQPQPLPAVPRRRAAGPRSAASRAATGSAAWPARRAAAASSARRRR